MGRYLDFPWGKPDFWLEISPLLMFMIQTMPRLRRRIRFDTKFLYNRAQHFKVSNFPTPLHTTLLITDATASFDQTLELSKDAVQECICVFHLIQISLRVVE